ncbi:MAG: biotin--[Prevotella sp.]|nr:biotin--[acetyl-CoA-carboxylase] ligase [Prevotella sp.]
MRLIRCFKRNKRNQKPDAIMPHRVIRLEETTSTNQYLRGYRPEEGEAMIVVVAANQTAGRGCGSNSWESERGKNLLLSILTHPVMVPIAHQFMLSMAGALAVKGTLDKYVEGITLKWPNDVYWQDKKICGTLIETSIGGGHIKDCIFGIGINVNQQRFVSDAPNPISLCQIIGHEVDLDSLLKELLEAFTTYYKMLENGRYNDISALYHDALYRGHGFFPYMDADGEFEGAIVEVEDNGRLIMRDRAGMIREYMFKEVEFII